MSFSPGTPARVVFGENLRRARVTKGLSQEALGGMAGVHRTFVGAVERAENNVSIDTMERLSSAVGRTVLELLDPNGLPE
jgi:transcriptional regulator with XRE-family HTH domain